MSTLADQIIKAVNEPVERGYSPTSSINCLAIRSVPSR